MTEAIEKLADMLSADITHRTSLKSLNTLLAEQILAAFQADPLAYVKPKPLEWVGGDGVTASKEYFTADNEMGGHYWTLEGELGCSFDLDAFDEIDYPTLEAAQAAAETHRNEMLAKEFSQ